MDWAICGIGGDARRNEDASIYVGGKDGQRWVYSLTDAYGVKEVYPMLFPLYWSSDNHYVFIALQSMCESPCPYGTYYAVWRMNLMTGETTEVLSPSFGVFDNGDRYFDLTLYYASISPTGRRLVYTYQYNQSDHLNIVDLSTGETQTLPFPPDTSGVSWFAWSPDGTKLILQIGGPLSETEWHPVYYSDLYFNFLTSASGMIFNRSPEYTQVAEFTDEYVIINLRDGNFWKYDLSDYHSLSTGTLTPTPTFPPYYP